MHICPNGKIYIGITSQLVEKRWQNGYGYRNSLFYNAINKYGWDNIIHKIIISNITQKSAEYLEQILIAKLQSNDRKFGYNITNGGHVFKHSDETKEKISNKLKGRKGHPVSQETIAKRLQTYKEKYPNGFHHSEETKKKISDKFDDNRRKKYSEMFSGTNSPSYGKTYTYEERGMKSRKGISNSALNKKIYQFNIHGKLIGTYINAIEAAEKTGSNAGCIRKCARGEAKHHNGYHWSYTSVLSQDILMSKTRERKILCFDNDLNLIKKYNSIHSVEIDGFCSAAVSACLRGRRKTSGGYIWRYAS